MSGIPMEKSTGMEGIETRELNEIEYLNYSIEQPYNLVVAISLKGSLPIDRLKAAIDSCQARHPLMRAQAWRDGKGIPKFHFDRASPIPLEVKVYQNDEQVHEIFKEELVTPFAMGEDVKNPLIRITYIKGTVNSALVVCAEHIITDGISMVLLIRDLFSMMNNPNLEMLAQEQVLIPRRDFDLLPAKVRRKIPTSTWKFNVILALMKFLHKLRFRNKGVRTKESCAAQPVFDPRTLQLVPFSLNQDETRALLARCKEEKVSVHSAVCTAFTTRFPVINSAVSLRDMLTVPIGEAFGLYASGAVVKMRYSPKITFWENARRFQRKLRTEMSPRKVFAIFSIFSKTIRVEKIQELGPILMDLKSNQDAFGITNLRSLDTAGIPLSGETYEAIGFDGAVSTTQNAKVISIFTLNGRMHLQFQYFASNDTRESVEHIVENATTLLRKNL